VLASHLSQAGFDLTTHAYVLVAVLRIAVPEIMHTPDSADMAIDAITKAVAALDGYTAD
jgi:hypothetical protein